MTPLPIGHRRSDNRQTIVRWSKLTNVDSVKEPTNKEAVACILRIPDNAVRCHWPQSKLFPTPGNTPIAGGGWFSIQNRQLQYTGSGNVAVFKPGRHC